MVVRQLKIRRGLECDGELERLAFGELNLLDVRLADHPEFLVGDGLAITVRDQPAFGFFVDLRGVALYDQVPRGFAGTKAGEADLLLKLARDFFERRVHRRRVQFHTH